MFRITADFGRRTICSALLRPQRRRENRRVKINNIIIIVVPNVISAHEKTHKTNDLESVLATPVSRPAAAIRQFDFPVHHGLAKKKKKEKKTEINKY